MLRGFVSKKVDQQTDQWTKLEIPEINSHIWSNDLQQGCQDHSTGKGQSLQQCWENWISTCKKVKLGPNITSSTKINTKWIDELM